jgi:tetratricopeptide (TPR) repeat protein
VAWPVWGAVALLVAWGATQGLGAQLPTEYKNLKVLPKEITRDDLAWTMRGYCDALGVRCTYCHVGEEGKPLTTYDFPSDQKPPKRVAREMMRMVADLNGKALARIDTGRADRREVACATCHHGLARPEELKTMLPQLAQAQGIDAALQKYRELREKFYGGYEYDFGTRPLGYLADRLAEQGQVAQAVKAQELNVELHPKDSYAQQSLGLLYRRLGEREKAITSLRKAVELDPANPWAAKLLEDVEKSPSQSTQ